MTRINVLSIHGGGSSRMRKDTFASLIEARTEYHLAIKLLDSAWGNIRSALDLDEDLGDEVDTDALEDLCSEIADYLKGLESNDGGLACISEEPEKSEEDYNEDSEDWGISGDSIYD